LLEELLELRIVSNNKVDHPRKKSKDLADAMCGSVYNAISHSKRDTFGEVEIHTWSSFKSERNQEAIADKDKPQMTPEIKEYLSNLQIDIGEKCIGMEEHLCFDDIFWFLKLVT
jgi:hypothetical protein